MSDDSIQEVLGLLSAPDWPGVYVLGCFGRYITVYSQQVRALNLVYALHRSGRVSAGTNVAVIGGGAAGLTAAAALARIKVSVSLFDKLDRPLGIQRGSTKRYIHPHIYDWPNQELDSNNADLPIMDWSADYADDVVKELEKHWDKEVASSDGRLRAHWRVSGVSIEPPGAADASRVTVSWNDQADVPHGNEFACVILAVGFGKESDRNGLQPRYWEDDGLDKIDDGDRKCLVSGCGDGGLTDVMRLCIRDFRHDRIVQLFAGDEQAREIGAQLLECDRAFRSGGKRSDLSKAFEEVLVDSLQKPLRDALRTDTTVYLTARSWWDVYTSRSSVLNRFIVSQLARLGAWSWREGPIESVQPRDAQSKHVVTFKNEKKETFDYVLTRYGPDAALKNEFPAVWKSCELLATRWRALPQHFDPTRTRLSWGNTFDAPAVEEGAALRDFKLVAFDLDGTLLRGPDYKWSWQLVWQYLGYDDKVRRRLMTDYVNEKRLTRPNWYKEWCDKSAKLFRDKNLKYSDFSQITEPLEPVDGVRETIRALKEAGFKVAIVSGGIDVFLERLGDLTLEFDYVFINRFHFDAQGVFTGVTTTPYDFDGKLAGVKFICDNEGFTLDQAVFVGDGFNDEYVIGKVGCTVAFMPTGAMMESNADVRVDKPDLREVLRHIVRSGAT